MAKMIFKIEGGDDMSVGIPDTHATVIFIDNYYKVDKNQVELCREFLREFYDIPKHMGTVLTLEEYKKEKERKDAYFEDMRADYENKKSSYFCLKCKRKHRSGTKIFDEHFEHNASHL